MIIFVRGEGLVIFSGAGLIVPTLEVEELPYEGPPEARDKYNCRPSRSFYHPSLGSWEGTALLPPHLSKLSATKRRLMGKSG